MWLSLLSVCVLLWHGWCCSIKSPSYNQHDDHQRLVSEARTFNNQTHDCFIPMWPPFAHDYHRGTPLSRGTSVKHGTVIAYSCPEGQKLAEGSPSWDNCHNRHWLNSLNSPARRHCVMDFGDCTPPLIPHANMSQYIAVQTKFRNGFTMQIPCATATDQEERFYTTCINGQWTRSEAFESICQAPATTENAMLRQRSRSGEEVLYAREENKEHCTTPYVAAGLVQLPFTHRSIELNGQFNYAFRHGFKLHVLCQNTGQPPSGGSDKLACDRGSWMARSGWPNCRTQCRLPAITNARTLYPSGSLIADGQSVVFECNTGFSFSVGTNRTAFTCRNGDWQHARTALECRRLEPAAGGQNNHEDPAGAEAARRTAHFAAPCFAPRLKGSDDERSPDRLLRHGDEHQIVCRTMHTRLGAATLRCLHGRLLFDGAWPQCRRMCSARAVRYAYPLNHQSAPALRVDHGFVARVICLSGFQLQGSPDIICENRKWIPLGENRSKPRCIPVNQRQ